MLSVIDAYILLAIGIALIGLEALITSFVIIWFGVGFVATALLSFGIAYEDGIWQLATAALISLVLLFTLRKTVLEAFLKSKGELSDNFLNEEGFGEIKHQKVFYKGTYWEIEGPLSSSDFEEGEKIKVLKTFKNSATVEKLS